MKDKRKMRERESEKRKIYSGVGSPLRMGDIILASVCPLCSGVHLKIRGRASRRVNCL